MMQLTNSLSQLWSRQLWVALFLSASLFAVPLSSTAKSIFLSVAVATIIFLPVYRKALNQTLSQPWCQAALLLFFMALLACLWGEAAFPQKMLVLEKYSKLLYLPILVVGFQDKRTRVMALHAFLVAMAFTCLLSILKYFGLLHLNGADPGQVFHNHIMTGYMIAFAAYLSAHLGRLASGKIRTTYVILFLIFSAQIVFINTGRTGYVIYGVLMLLFVGQMLSWRYFALVFLLGSSLALTIYYQNESVHNRITVLADDWNHYHQMRADNSLRYRFLFHEFAETLFKKDPWLGNGTGGFTHAFDKEKPVPSWDRRLLEPHSFYWLVAAEFGVMGLLVLSFFFVSLSRAAFQLQAMRPIAFAVLIPYMIGNLSDSLLFYSGTGYFFILLMAICLGEWVNHTPNKPAINCNY